MKALNQNSECDNIELSLLKDDIDKKNYVAIEIRTTIGDYAEYVIYSRDKLCKIRNWLNMAIKELE